MSEQVLEALLGDSEPILDVESQEAENSRGSVLKGAFWRYHTLESFTMDVAKGPVKQLPFHKLALLYIKAQSVDSKVFLFEFIYDWLPQLQNSDFQEAIKLELMEGVSDFRELTQHVPLPQITDAIVWEETIEVLHKGVADLFLH